MGVIQFVSRVLQLIPIEGVHNQTCVASANHDEALAKIELKIGTPLL